MSRLILNNKEVLCSNYFVSTCFCIIFVYLRKIKEEVKNKCGGEIAIKVILHRKKILELILFLLRQFKSDLYDKNIANKIKR